MTEVELYQELGALTKDKEKWKEHIPYVASLLSHDSCKIRAKALWLLGEMGLVYSQSVQDVVPEIAAFLDSPTPLLRERAVNALGRIGRGSYPLIEPYWADMFRFACDEESKVRLAFIWASENIATNTPDLYADHMSVFEKLLHDADDKVRMEAPEIFRVLGKRRHEFVRPYLEQLRKISETDDIKELRTKEGLSQSALAKRLGIATSAIGHMENGRMKVSAKIAAKVKEEFGIDLAEKAATAKKAVKETTKKVSTKAKVAAKKTDKKVVAEKIEAKKTARKAAGKAKETVKKVEKAVKAPAKKAQAAKLEIVIQSPMGGNITSEEIAAKLPKDAETVFVRVDQNKLWWIKGEETGSVDIW